MRFFGGSGRCMLLGMSIPVEMLRRVARGSQGEARAITRPDAERILEIACLAVAADGVITDSERAALHVFSAELGSMGAAELDALAYECLTGTRDERDERLRRAAEALSSTPARHLAYQVSVATALADLATADQEFEFDLDVQAALDLAPAVVDELAASVHRALDAEGG